MIGINNTSLVYGVLDLIRQEIDRNGRYQSIVTNTGVDPLEGTPSVVLERYHPDDKEVLTGARLFYSSNWVVNIQLGLGMTDEEIAAALEKNNYSRESNQSNGSEPEVLPDFNELSPEEQDGTSFEEELGTDFDSTGLISENTLDVLPEDIVDSSHPEFEFYTKWRLSNVAIETLDETEEVIDTFNIKLIYDYKGMLNATIVFREPREDEDGT